MQEASRFQKKGKTGIGGFIANGAGFEDRNRLQRAYTAPANEWLNYIRRLKLAYSYLYSLAVRLNPLDPNARPEVTDRAG